MKKPKNGAAQYVEDVLEFLQVVHRSIFDPDVDPVWLEKSAAGVRARTIAACAGACWHLGVRRKGWLVPAAAGVGQRRRGDFSRMMAVTESEAMSGRRQGDVSAMMGEAAGLMLGAHRACEKACDRRQADASRDLINAANILLCAKAMLDRFEPVAPGTADGRLREVEGAAA